MKYKNTFLSSYHFRYGEEFRFLPWHVLPLYFKTKSNKDRSKKCTTLICVCITGNKIRPTPTRADEFMTTVLAEPKAWNACCFYSYFSFSPYFRRRRILRIKSQIRIPLLFGGLNIAVAFNSGSRLTFGCQVKCPAADLVTAYWPGQCKRRMERAQKELLLFHRVMCCFFLSSLVLFDLSLCCRADHKRNRCSLFTCHNYNQDNADDLLSLLESLWVLFYTYGM